MAYSALTGYLTAQFNWSVSGPVVSSGISFPPAASANTIAFKESYGLGSGAGLINVVACNILTITASSSATLNLGGLTDVLGTTGVVLVRLKEYIFVLLSAAQDSVNGSAASAVVVQGGSSNPNTLNLGGTTPTATLTNGDTMAYATTGAAGITVSGSVENVKISNSDGAIAAGVLYGFGGATS